MPLDMPERSVKWHASLVVRLLLEERNMPLNDSVSDWSSSLPSTISQACRHEDISLAQVAFPVFLFSVERIPEAQKIVMEKGLNSMRDIAKQTTKHKQVQEAMAKALELLCTGDLHLSLEDSQKWSGILLPWVFGTFSSNAIRFSAIKILSQILEDYGPTSVPVSQGWLAMGIESQNMGVKSPNKWLFLSFHINKWVLNLKTWVLNLKTPLQLRCSPQKKPLELTSP